MSFQEFLIFLVQRLDMHDLELKLKFWDYQAKMSSSIQLKGKL